MKKLVLVRHGESTWNKENRFTGWTDVDLSEKGVEEAIAGGRALRDEGYVFDVAYTSVLKRAIKTLWLALEQTGPDVDPGAQHVAAQRAPLRRAAGPQQGRDGREARRWSRRNIWRRSYDVPPPALTPDDPRHPEPRPALRGLSPADLPLTECLKDTVARFLPLLARDHRAGGQIGPARAHRRARQQPARAGEVPRQHSRTRTSSTSTSRPASRWSTN